MTARLPPPVNFYLSMRRSPWTLGKKLYYVPRCQNLSKDLYRASCKSLKGRRRKRS